MNIFILITVLCLSNLNSFASTIIGRGYIHQVGGSLDCVNSLLIQKAKKQAEKSAFQMAKWECEAQEGTEFVILKRVSDFNGQVRCFYRGPWMSIAVIEIKTDAKYRCSSY